MKKIGIIGANEFQNRLVLKAKNLGYETHVFAWKEGAIAKENSDYFYPLSIIDKDKILEIMKNIKADGICSIGSDLAMPTVNFIATKLNLIGNSLETTLVSTDKYEMRKRLVENNIECPQFKLIKNEKEIPENFKYPLIIKPKDRSGSRGISKINNSFEAKIAIEEALRESFSQEILVEEYIDGKEYSVEMISQNGKHRFLQITEKFTTGAPNFIEKGHLSPARELSSVRTNEIIEMIKKSLNCLEIKNGASHSEIKIDKQGKIKIIEIAGRMGGDFIGSDMVEISTGIDFTKLVLDVALNKKIDIIDNNKYRANCLVRFIFNENDLKKYREIKKLYPEIFKDECVKNINNEVVRDSSARKGYYILEIKELKTLESILAILEESKDD